MRLSLVISLGSLAFLIACADSTLPEYNQLGGLRLLALKADTPEVAAGATITLTPVVSDLPTLTQPGGRTLTYGVEGCTDPGVSLGATPDCTQIPDRTIWVAKGTAIPSLASATSTYTALAPTFTVTVPATLLANRSTTDQANGVSYLVIYTLTATDTTSGMSESIKSVKRLIASTRTTKNSNPSLTGVLADIQAFQTYLNAIAFSGSAFSAISLTPQFLAGSEETYTLQLSNGTTQTKTETLTTTWFYSDGVMKRYRTASNDTNSWTSPSTAPTSGHTGMVFYVVVRDGRGGEDFLRFEK